jgi:pSer/pThr/pTyr-binding forkhead associated (FHA) protein
VVYPKHVEIALKEIRGYDRVFIKDKGSKNGTWVVGRRVLTDKAVELKRGTTLTFGSKGNFPTA